ncbi:hypothetical protein EHQ16_03140 [Leptospira kanakyensis]|uniref:Uncharacterized protein n=1 Tax=Leptospira kanakyensis TaxID=2484968 RepID=A0A6N4Q7V1_9LEPT|nr:hypothetical protein EHQ11_16490 [Leptospira kanakyensis]TGK63462.1 hypothetical protein EHQ16_03140 [Leptospira kanakyensis]TGK67065.1 hypothetical protein EHQ18_18375 [Leptospira kanakyensis]
MNKRDEQQIKTFSASTSDQEAARSYTLRSFRNSFQFILGFASRFREGTIHKQGDCFSCTVKSKRTSSIKQGKDGGICEKSESGNKSKKIFGGVPMRTHFYMQPPLLHYKKQNIVDRFISFVLGE